MKNKVMLVMVLALLLSIIMVNSAAAGKTTYGWVVDVHKHTYLWTRYHVVIMERGTQKIWTCPITSGAYSYMTMYNVTDYYGTNCVPGSS